MPENQGNRDVAPQQLVKHLKGLDFPADKNQVVQKAESQNAPDNVLQVLRNLPDRRYESPVEIEKAFGQMS